MQKKEATPFSKKKEIYKAGCTQSNKIFNYLNIKYQNFLFYYKYI